MHRCLPGPTPNRRLRETSTRTSWLAPLVSLFGTLRLSLGSLPSPDSPRFLSLSLAARFAPAAIQKDHPSFSWAHHPQPPVSKYEPGNESTKEQQADEND